jgi:hypothetical protein
MKPTVGVPYSSFGLPSFFKNNDAVPCKQGIRSTGVNPHGGIVYSRGLSMVQ